MLPSRLFRSRWSALLWAGGVIWTAYDVAMANRQPSTQAARPAAAQDATGEAVDANDLAVLAQAGR